MLANMEAELKAVALAAGLADLDLLPLIRHDGTPAGIRASVEAFKAAKPAYFRQSMLGVSRAEYDASKQAAVRALRRTERDLLNARGRAPTGNLKTLDQRSYRAAIAAARQSLRGR